MLSGSLKISQAITRESFPKRETTPENKLNEIRKIKRLFYLGYTALIRYVCSHLPIFIEMLKLTILRKNLAKYSKNFFCTKISKPGACAQRLLWTKGTGSICTPNLGIASQQLSKSTKTIPMEFDWAIAKKASILCKNPS